MRSSKTSWIAPRFGLDRADKSGPSGRRRRTTRRRKTTGLTIRTRWSGNKRLSFPRSGASDPDWTAMRLLPRPGRLIDRYLAVVFTEPPSAEELRDLRYVAARNRLTMYDPQAV